jgi:large subunit ribosomal protein L46
VAASEGILKLSPEDSLSDAPQQATPVLHPKQTHRIRAGLILMRPPLLTRPLTPFESAFFLYQKRLNERLSSPFRKDPYFKPDTALALDWQIKFRERGHMVGKDFGTYKMGPNDEVAIEDTLATREHIYNALLRDAETRVSEDGEVIPEAERVPVEQPMPRRTKADESGDVRRLDRELDRTLYLVVQTKGAGWGFPAANVQTDENLHEVRW